MSDATISDVRAWEALDSRGRPTVACRVTTADGAHGRATVPSGASTGTFEAVELRDGGARYGGSGVLRAVEHVNSRLRDAVIGMDAADQAAIDRALVLTDADPALRDIGANAVLAVSLASLLAAADSARMPLYAYAANRAPLLPMPMVNIFSGGAHAGRAVDIQDVLVVPLGARSFAEAMEMVAATRAKAAESLRSRGFNAALVADEGGLAASLPSNRAALELVTEAIGAAGMRLGVDGALAIDVAANQIGHEGGIRLDSEQRFLDEAAWVAELETWVADYPIVSLEDVLPDDAWDGWSIASEALAHRVQLLGDDLFVTNSELLARGIDAGIANAILVKPNQAGTVTRACNAVELASSSGYATVISARSGETEDSWLADLAVAWSTGQIKVGSTMRSERTAKWNRLLEIEAESPMPMARFPTPRVAKRA